MTSAVAYVPQVKDKVGSRLPLHVEAPILRVRQLVVYVIRSKWIGRVAIFQAGNIRQSSEELSRVSCWRRRQRCAKRIGEGGAFGRGERNDERRLLGNAKRAADAAARARRQVGKVLAAVVIKP